MTWIDWAIVLILLTSTVGGLVQGFFRSACALIGLFLGLSVAAWNYRLIANLILWMVHSEAVADIVGFLLIALMVMALCNVIGTSISKTLEWMGLGCLDMAAGAVLGFFQGALLVTLCLMGIAAFFPQTQWLAQSRLPRLFIAPCHLSSHMTPSELGDKVRHGLRTLEFETPGWMHPKNGVS